MADAVASERLVVVWRVTTRCSLSCGFCAYDRRLPFARSDADEAAVRALEALLLRARRESGRAVHVSFLGGEPFGWEPLARVARSFRAQGLSLGITSNGVTLGSDWARELLLECFDEVTLSIDGLGARHDDVRGWPGGFQRLSTALCDLARHKKIRGRGPLLRVNTVLMRDNIRQFPELCRALAAWGVEELSFNRLGGRDRPEFFAAQRLSPADLEEFALDLPALRQELSARGLRILGAPGYLDRLLSLERAERVAVPDCDPGQRFLFVDEHGQIAPCSFSLDSYGESLAPQPAPREWSELPRRFLMRQRSKRDVACDDCASTHVFEKFRGA